MTPTRPPLLALLLVAILAADALGAEKLWAFGPLANSPPPTVTRKTWVKNPIDQFILAQLDSKTLQPAPEADRATLIRRLTFDLHGLPPTRAETDAFLADRSPEAYEKLVDRLLKSDRYGERWGRHWLDLARYADSDGFKSDSYRPTAWRYRDYVIRSMNADKPYGRFIQEQIAGDELFAENEEAQVATGFLRHWPFENNQKDVARQVDEMLTDVTEVTGEAILGVGLRCARCHDHKYDPIPQRDYYRFRAFFAALVPKQRRVLSDQAVQMTQWETATSDLRRQMLDLEQKNNAKRLAGARRFFPHYLQAIYKKPIDQWTPRDKQYVHFGAPQIRGRAGNQKLKGEAQKQMSLLKNQMKKHDSLRPKMLSTMMAVTDIGPTAPPTTIPGKTGQTIAPGFLSILTSAQPSIRPTTQSTGRRSSLARWLSSPDNPLPWRVVVNRMWQHHFAVGIVATPNDFGAQGTPPTHPKLLDWLARRFLADGQSFKKMHRLMVTSATYRMTSGGVPSATARTTDPSNHLLWRQRSRRLDAEQIRDGMLAISGELSLKMGGGGVDGTRTPKRSIYVKNIRNKHNEILDAFDSANLFSSCATRTHTTTPLQALLTMNGSWSVSRAKAFAKKLGKGTTPQKITHAFHDAFGRAPTPIESQQAAAFVGASPSTQHWEDFCHVLLNANGFLYVD
jgi:hypothetical protein